MRRAALVLIAFVTATSSIVSTSLAETIDKVVEQEVRENDTSATIQERINQLADDTEAMASQYRSSLENTRQLEIYNRQLEGLITAQVEEMASLRRQIDEVTVVGRRVLPLMVRMIDGLEHFIALDVPFLLEERQTRVADLRAMMDRADVTIAEKYRRILEAYQIENEYGRTIEAYRGKLEDDAPPRTVDFLRVGRTVLLYQTLDGRESGAWDAQAGAWTEVSGYRIPIQRGIRMARKQVPPDLIQVPMPAPEAVR
jgi:hypothetical protein